MYNEEKKKSVKTRHYFLYNEDKNIVYIRIPKNGMQTCGDLVKFGYRSETDLKTIDWHKNRFITFIRNPLERFISAFFQHERNRVECKQIKPLNEYSKNEIINDFVEEINKIKECNLNHMGRFDEHYLSQKYYLGEKFGVAFLPIDVYLIFENFIEEFNRVLRPSSKMPDNYELSWQNKNKDFELTEYIRLYISANRDIKNLINNKYKEDWIIYLEQPKRRIKK